MSGKTSNLNSRYQGVPSPNIRGREKEMFSIILTLLRAEKRNILLTGLPGVGKTAIVNQLAWNIANEICPKELIGYKIHEVHTNELLAGPGYRGVTEEKFQKLIDGVVSRGKIILFFDEFHTVENLGRMANGQTPGLSNMLKPYLTGSDLIIIGATTTKECKEMEDQAFLRRFTKIEIQEPEDNIVKDIIRANYTKFCKLSNNPITWGEDAVEAVFRTSQNINGSMPDKAIDLCDLSVAYCRLKELDQVHKEAVKVASEFKLSQSGSASGI